MKKVLCAVLAAVLACVVAGCAKKETSVPDSSDISQSVPEKSTDHLSSISVSDNSTVSNNLSNDVISPSFEIELNGQSICLPCKVKDINGIKIDTEYSFGSYQRDDGKYMSFAFYYYNDIRAGQIYLEGDCTGKTDLAEEKVIGLSLKTDSIPMSYMGLTSDSNMSDIVGIFGEPDLGGDTCFTYYIEPEGSVLIDLNPKGKVSEIWLYTDLH